MKEKNLIGILKWGCLATNVMVFIFGLCLAIMGALLYNVRTYPDSNGPVIYVTFGVFVMVISGILIVGVILNNNIILFVFSTLTIALCIANVVIFIIVTQQWMSLKYSNETNNTLRGHFQNVENATSEKFVMKIQQDFKCCGLDGPEDWFESIANHTLKDQKFSAVGDACRYDKSDCKKLEVFEEGCFKKVYVYVESLLYACEIILIISTLFQVFAVVVCITYAVLDKWNIVVLYVL
ncbi:unnamed protein product [Brassicogethes aeneus]|uniref:Tetraspanin n=1 Tax=Brassicogethes aeneus TaxID=1431903 RepID=A0A9P0B5M0_BRAAE|nr:unnamed protein product [Brassicogethes aeneus]